MVSLKVVAVGDRNVGKRWLLRTYKDGAIPTDEVTYPSEGYKTSVIVRDKPIGLVLWSVDCSEASARLRQLTYPLTWFPEIIKHCPDVPKILVGTKRDLVCQKARQKMSEKAHVLAKRLKAQKYIETSSLCSEGLQEVFTEVVHAVLCVRPKPADEEKRCEDKEPNDKEYKSKKKNHSFKLM